MDMQVIFKRHVAMPSTIFPFDGVDRRCKETYCYKLGPAIQDRRLGRLLPKLMLALEEETVPHRRCAHLALAGVLSFTCLQLELGTGNEAPVYMNDLLEHMSCFLKLYLMMTTAHENMLFLFELCLKHCQTWP